MCRTDFVLARTCKRTAVDDNLSVVNTRLWSFNYLLLTLILTYFASVLWHGHLNSKKLSSSVINSTLAAIKTTTNSLNAIVNTEHLCNTIRISYLWTGKIKPIILLRLHEHHHNHCRSVTLISDKKERQETSHVQLPFSNLLGQILDFEPLIIPITICKTISTAACRSGEFSILSSNLTRRQHSLPWVNRTPKIWKWHRATMRTVCACIPQNACGNKSLAWWLAPEFFLSDRLCWG